MDNEQLAKIEAASYLLPDPGGEVVRKLIAELRLRERAAYNAGVEDAAKIDDQAAKEYKDIAEDVGEWPLEENGYHSFAREHEERASRIRDLKKEV